MEKFRGFKISTELFGEIMQNMSYEAVQEFRKAAEEAMDVYQDKMGESLGINGDFDAWKRYVVNAEENYQAAFSLYGEATWWAANKLDNEDKVKTIGA